MGETTGGRAVVDLLEAEQVRYIFGILRATFLDVRAALRAAMTGRRGPVFVEIPRDVLNDEMPTAATVAPENYRITHPQPPHPDAIRDAARRLRQAERPLLLVGGGTTWAGANDLVVRLSEQYSIPMITAYGRNDAVPNGHPLYIGP